MQLFAGEFLDVPHELFRGFNSVLEGNKGLDPNSFDPLLSMISPESAKPFLIFKCILRGINPDTTERFLLFYQRYITIVSCQIMGNLGAWDERRCCLYAHGAAA